MIIVNTAASACLVTVIESAAYVQVDDSRPAIRRVEHDVDREIRAHPLAAFPHAGWIAQILDSGHFRMP
jgi:hypothetical protein